MDQVLVCLQQQGKWTVEINQKCCPKFRVLMKMTCVYYGFQWCGILVGWTSHKIELGVRFGMGVTASAGNGGTRVAEWARHDSGIKMRIHVRRMQTRCKNE